MTSEEFVFMLLWIVTIIFIVIGLILKYLSLR